jgi:hypothetical protein
MSASFTCNRCGYTENPMRHSKGCNGKYQLAGKGYRCEACGDFWRPSGRAWCVSCKSWTTDYSTNPPVHACFPGDALIQTPTRSRRITTLAPGDQVLSYCASSRRFTAQHVTRLLTHPEATIWEVRFSTRSEPLRTTGYHTFLTERGWVRTDRLRADDCMVSDSVSGNQRILSVAATPAVEPVYNLVTTGDHTFIADGIVAHNFTFARAARTVVHKWFLDPWSLPAGQATLTERGERQNAAPGRFDRSRFGQGTISSPADTWCR